ncbi:Formyl-CoA:oxalate CoA-transferase [Cladobotryum mycophilum]|uniref:Formyl-CoA:oxalate CoA-transferase n=1 Tax=Cladobotryum mycophilum TaxID=491253 RepID=A0ABR0SWW4_9HYPO
MAGFNPASSSMARGMANRDGVVVDEICSSPLYRTTFSAYDVVREIWSSLKLPQQALESLDLAGHGNGPALPSSFKIGVLAQSSIALSALGAAMLYATRARGSMGPEQEQSRVPRVRVGLEHAVVEFQSERLYSMENRPLESSWGALGGLHRAADGYVRIHDVFPHHAAGTLELLGLPPGATRGDVAAKTALWKAVDLENAGTVDGKLAIYALRSYEEWDALPQAKATDDSPILLKRLSPGVPNPAPLPVPVPVTDSRRCLSGIRVLEMSRVIAAPVAGKTLAAHGADVLWVTSPNLPSLPVLDRNLGRGKRSIQLDIHEPQDKEKLVDLLRTCDVFIQSYRPGSLASYGFSPEELAKINPTIVCANLSAFGGPGAPWAGRRGFDSLVQTCSGMNASEAEHAGRGEPARAMPCQALDHASGYLLATGITAALYHRSTTPSGGGAYTVDVSLAGTAKYLRSLGQYPGTSGFDESSSSSRGRGYESMGDVPDVYFEELDTGFGRMKGVRHSAVVEGCVVGWDRGLGELGSGEPVWL